MVLGGLANCAPLPPEPMQTGQLPEFTVLTAVPSVGDLDYSLTTEGHIDGSLTVKRQVGTTHPIRIAVVWLEPQFTDFTQPFWSSLALQADQQLLLTASAAVGTNAFSAELVAPPAAALRVRSSAECIGGEDKYARATLVAYIDTNDNGVLELANGPLVDHVLSSSDFPTLLLGDQRGTNQLAFISCGTTSFYASRDRSTQPVYDDPRLDLVACLREDRFAVDGACGISNDEPVIEFSGTREDELVFVGVNAHRSEVDIILDETQRAVAGTANVLSAQFGGQQLGVGSHRIRAERRGVVIWEARFTLPDRTWVKEARRAPGGAYDVHFQEVAGASSYDVIASRTMSGGGVSSPVRLEPGFMEAEPSMFLVTARFAELPFSSSSLQKRQ